MEKKKEMREQASLLLRLENFRIFKDSDWFEIAPLTCLVGRNSSGKSSVLSALLLLKQTMEHEVGDRRITPLVLSGPYCDLGDYNDVVHNHKESSDITFSFSLPMSALASIDPSPRSPIVSVARPRRRVFSRYYYPYHLQSTKSWPTGGRVTMSLTFAGNKELGPSLSGVEIVVPNIGGVKFVRTISGERSEHWRTYTNKLPPRSLSLRQAALFPFITVNTSSYNSSGQPMKRKLRIFTSATSRMSGFLHSLLLETNLAGPFRTPPARRYTFAGLGTAQVGPTGEQVFDLLIAEALLKSREKMGLHTELAFWIKRLQLADSFRVKDLAKKLNLFEVDIRGAGPGTRANIADVGFGLSQILPVLVQGLLTRPGGLFLVQQPEIHLHPDAQAGLADFFMYLASCGITTLVETPSEYLLLRLRRRLAERAKPTGPFLKRGQPVPVLLTRDNVNVLFAGFEDNGEVLRKIEIGESFQFENLPAGFMSQALDDRLALLKATSKRHV
jgi:hypothetical protein